MNLQDLAAFEPILNGRISLQNMFVQCLSFEMVFLVYYHAYYHLTQIYIHGVVKMLEFQKMNASIQALTAKNSDWEAEVLRQQLGPKLGPKCELFWKVILFDREGRSLWYGYFLELLI